MVNLRPLKEFASQRLRRDSPLRELILAQHDDLDAETFVAKIDDWLRLLPAESKPIR